MPKRFLRPGIRTSPRWNAVSHRAARLYVAILTLADDYGRYDGRPAVLWADAFAVWNEQNPPEDAVNCQQVAADCAQLSAAELIEFYDVSGRRYLQVIQWEERVRSESKWPEPPQTNADICPQKSAEIRRNPPPSARARVSPSSPSPSPPSSASSVEPTPTPKPAKNGIAEVESLLNELGKLYNKPASERNTDEEIYAAAQLIRERGERLKDEMCLIVSFRRCLPADKVKYFPKYRLRLIQKWQDVLDEARGTTKPDSDPDLKKFEKQLDRWMTTPNQIDKSDALE